MMIKTLFLLSFLFFIYSFIGWILEVVQSAFHQKRLVNRGFINSPLCISYGIGAIVITINTHQMTGLWIFAAAMIDATVIEWFGGHFIEHFTMNAGGIIPKINGILMATSACPIRFSGDF